MVSFQHLFGRETHLPNFLLPGLQGLPEPLLELCGGGLLVSSHLSIPCVQEKKEALL